MTIDEPQPIAAIQVDALRALVFEDRAQLGRAAAFHVARVIAARQAEADRAHVVFAAAPSQREFLAGLVAHPSIDWQRVVAFHMDEYLGLDADHPASFRRYLNEHLFLLADLGGDRLHLIEGENRDRPLIACLDYEEQLRARPPDLVCGGIGENGHLAFNDPGVADFLDPVGVKTVRLDAACRAQQVADGCFSTLEEVPTHAITLTIPMLLSAESLSIVVPGPRKAEAVLATLRGPIDESCPASILRRHPGAVLFLDAESARLVL